MKVYFIGNNYDGCFYVRCLQPLIHNGWDGMKTSLSSPKASSEQMFQGAMNADVVVFQRPSEEMKVKVADLLKQAGKIVVFDNDDTYKANSGVPYQMIHKDLVEKMDSNLMEFIKKADIVTTTTEFLAEEYREHNKNVHILPNCVDPDDWDSPLKNETDKVRIGLVGSVTLNGDYDNIVPVLKQLSDREDVELVVFGLPPKEDRFKVMQDCHKKEIEFWNSLNIDWQPLVAMENYFETLNELRLDIMLIPRAENYFNKCKSNLKFLEAGMLEIPIIASSFSDGNSPYDKDIEQGVNGLLVKDKEDWLPAIEMLVKDKELRQEIGKNAKVYVLHNYNIKNNYLKWKELYATYLNRKQ
jgi:glycosyltransferase involved in cell wall biosynthesis